MVKCITLWLWLDGLKHLSRMIEAIRTMDSNLPLVSACWSFYEGVEARPVKPYFFPEKTLKPVTIKLKGKTLNRLVNP